MGELLRPPPPRSWRERVAARLAVVTPGRVLSGAAAVGLVAVTAWWLLRPGRLEVQIEIGLPDEKGRAQIRDGTGECAHLGYRVDRRWRCPGRRDCWLRLEAHLSRG